MNEHSYYETDGYHIYFQFSMKKNVWPPDGSGADGGLLMADGSWLTAQAHGPWPMADKEGRRQKRKKEKNAEIVKLKTTRGEHRARMGN